MELDANQVDCHHKKPLVLGGNDSYQNLIIVSDVVHILIHSCNERTIRKYLKVLNPDKAAQKALKTNEEQYFAPGEAEQLLPHKQNDNDCYSGSKHCN